MPGCPGDSELASPPDARTPNSSAPAYKTKINTAPIKNPTLPGLIICFSLMPPS